MDSARPSASEVLAWPSLPLENWLETYQTLHMWTQVAGKIRLALAPHVNHWWQVPLYVSARGLATSPIPYQDHVFEIEFDFIDHRLTLRHSSGDIAGFRLEPMAVADFYTKMMETLRSAGVEVRIRPMPCEVENPIPLDLDRVHASYDPEYAHRFWRILLSADTIFKEFRSAFIGKSSPVHFFWGSFDLAVTRFSGRPAPEREGADAITREAYSHEVSSAGFWPGGGDVRGAAFYAYAYPEPAGFASAAIKPEAAFYSSTLKEFILMYDDVRLSPSPRETLRSFLESTYAAAASLGRWDRAALERGALGGSDGKAVRAS